MRAVARSDREEGSQLVSDTRPTARRMNLVIAPSTVRPVEAEERIAWVSQALCRTTDPDELFVRGAAQRKASMARIFTRGRSFVQRPDQLGPGEVGD